MLVRLDHAFFKSIPSSLSRLVSDHVPIVMTASSRIPTSSIFRFEKTWVLSAQYKEMVSSICARPQNQDARPIQHLVRSQVSAAESKI